MNTDLWGVTRSIVYNAEIHTYRKRMFGSRIKEIEKVQATHIKFTPIPIQHIVFIPLLILSSLWSDVSRLIYFKFILKEGDRNWFAVLSRSKKKKKKKRKRKEKEKETLWVPRDLNGKIYETYLTCWESQILFQDRSSGTWKEENWEHEATDL